MVSGEFCHWPSIFNLVYHTLRYTWNHVNVKRIFFRAALVAQRFSATFSSGRDPRDPVSSPMSDSLHWAWFSLCLSLYVSHE